MMCDHILSFIIKLAWRAKTDLFVSKKTIGADLILGPWYKHEILVVILHSNEQQSMLLGVVSAESLLKN